MYTERIPLLSALPAPARASARLLRLAADGSLFARGTKPRSMYVVVDGEVRLVRRTSTGSEIVLQRARCGFLAEASLGQPRYHCDAVAATDAEVIAIPERAFHLAIDDATFRNLWMVHLSQELRRTRAQNERLSLKTAEERIVHYIEAEGNQGCVVLSQTRKDWAAELGLTHEATYRALARMSQRGQLSIDGARISLAVI
jgi:CRP/FNR family transcriptional regulator, dissimilatory nitrate respiration regulator